MFLSEKCSKSCPENCQKTYFIAKLDQTKNMFDTSKDTSSEKAKTQLTLDYYQNYYISVIYEPKMVFVQYIIAIVNSLSLWHGINFRYLLDVSIEILVIIYETKYLIIARKFIEKKLRFIVITIQSLKIALINFAKAIFNTIIFSSIGLPFYYYFILMANATHKMLFFVLKGLNVIKKLLINNFKVILWKP